MPAQGFSLYQDVYNKKKTLQTLNPRELGLLATNFKDTDVGLGAERWIQSAPMSYWQQHMKPHPTAIWDAQENLAPLPVTGASLLNPIYDPGGPVAYWLQKQPVTSVQQPVTSARAKVTRQAAVDPRTGTVAGTGIDTTGVAGATAHKAAVETGKKPTLTTDTNNRSKDRCRPERYKGHANGGATRGSCTYP